MSQLQTLTLHPEAGEHIAVDHLPGDELPFIYLHGLHSVREGVKSAQLLDLAQKRNRGYYRFDFRGHGDSSGQLGLTTITDLVADTRAVLDHAGRAILVGSSLGGLIAAWTAAKHPKAVEALILMAPAFGFIERMAARRRDEAMTLAPGDRELKLDKSVLEDAARYDESQLGHRLTMPTMMIHGALDDTVPHSITEHLFAQIEHDKKELWILEDGDHRLSEPIDKIYERMERFLA